jgi:hypothetical protein
LLDYVLGELLPLPDARDPSALACGKAILDAQALLSA